MTPERLAVLAATSSSAKIRELDALLGSAIRLEPPPPDWEPPEETGSSFRENALLKARHLALHAGQTALADDSGLEVAALGGAPGIRSARYASTDDERIERLLRDLSEAGGSDRRASFRCVLALVHPGGREEVVVGDCAGVITEDRRGQGGFGYDPVFLPDGETKTFAELTADEKGRISHRAEAARRLLDLVR